MRPWVEAGCGAWSLGASPAANCAAKILVRRRVTRYDGGLRSPRRWLMLAPCKCHYFVVIALVVVGALFGYQQQKKRREALRLLADRMGWQFRADSDYDHDDGYAQFGIFRRALAVCLQHARGPVDIHGVNWPVKMGDYHYQVTSHNGKSSTTHTYHFSYVLLRLPYRRIPDCDPPGRDVRRAEKPVRVRRHRLRVGGISRRCVKSPDRRFAYDVIHRG